jgi:DNA-binding transcriptional ArsR family regulator
MQATLGFLVALLFVLNAVQAAPEQDVSLSFATPGAFHGNVTESSGVRLLLMFQEARSTKGSLSMELTGTSTVTNFTSTFLTAHQDAVGGVREMPVREDPPAVRTGVWTAVSLDMDRPGSSSVYVEADSINVTLPDSAGDILLKGADGGMTLLAPEDSQDPQTYRGQPLPDGEAYLREMPKANQAFHVRASGIHVVEWFNAASACAGDSPCPEGGGRLRTQAAGPATAVVTYDQDSYERLETSGGALTASGLAGLMLLGGPALDLHVEGLVRLPMAQGQTFCEGCALPANQTLTATGRLLLSGIHPSSPTRMTASIGGALDAARYDEQGVSPSLMTGRMSAVAAVGALAVGGAFGIRTIVALFSRKVRDPLLHPRRRRIYEYILVNPGANFRTLVRDIGIASGTVRHHLTILHRMGLIEERAHGATRRFFENHGRFEGKWTRVVLLREPNLRQLHEFLVKRNHWHQKEVLEAMQELHGWSRSTTQHRLARLVEGGLLQCRFEGRYKAYIPMEAPKPGPTAVRLDASGPLDTDVQSARAAIPTS